MLSIRRISVYFSIPFISICIFPLLALYNEQFALFTLVAAVISLMFNKKMTERVVIVFLTLLSIFLYWYYIKGYFVNTDGALNSRMVNYITGIGWGSVNTYWPVILWGTLIISPLFYILSTYNNKWKMNSIFVAILSPLMFTKYIWNPSINHLASVLPFLFMPFIVLYFNKGTETSFLALISSISNIRRALFLFLHKYYLIVISWAGVKGDLVLEDVTKNYNNQSENGLKSQIPLKIKTKLTTYRGMFFTLCILIVTTLSIITSDFFTEKVAYQYKYISSFKTEEFFLFPRKIYVDSSFKIILNDYTSLVKEVDEKIVLMTQHDNMLSMNLKKNVGSPFSDFTTNIRTQKDVDTVSIFLKNKQYCTVIDRRDKFYYLPYGSESNLDTIGALHKSRANILNVFKKVQPRLKFISRSEFFELHCTR